VAIVRRDGQVHFASDHGPELWRRLDAPPRYFAALKPSSSNGIAATARREPQLVRSHLRPDCLFIDILFLGVVYPHKRLDRFDDALPIPDEVAIDFSGREALGEPSKESRRVDDLSMGSAHGAQSMTVDQEFADLRVDGAFVPALALGQNLDPAS
jgi:hypothetical protein